MTPEKLKQLAEFAAKFVGFTQDDSRIWWPNDLPVDGFDPDEVEYALFECVETAPILAHLAEMEMEKRKFGIVSETPTESWNYYYCKIYQGAYMKAEEADENEYIALWSAIMATGEK